MSTNSDKRILIVYGSIEGQTEKIVHFMADICKQKDITVNLVSGEKSHDDFGLSDYDGVIIAVSVHMGKYPGYISKYIVRNRERLQQIPTAFVSVCMAIHSDKPEDRQEAQGYIDKLLRQTKWQPQRMVAFAGAIKYTQYNFLIRFIMKLIAKKEGAATDTSRDHEYTNWKEVEKFTLAYLALL